MYTSLHLPELVCECINTPLSLSSFSFFLSCAFSLSVCVVLWRAGCAFLRVSGSCPYDGGPRTAWSDTSTGLSWYEREPDRKRKKRRE